MGALLRIAASIFFFTMLFDPMVWAANSYAKECEQILNKEEDGDYVHWEGFMDSRLEDAKLAEELVADFYSKKFLTENVSKDKDGQFFERRCEEEILSLRKLIFVRGRYSPRWFAANSSKVCLDGLKKLCKEEANILIKHTNRR